MSPTRGRVEVDTSWYRARGLVASVSHRVVFHDAPVLARLGGPGVDLRTAVVRARRAAHRGKLGRDGRHRRRGGAGELAERPAASELEGLAAGRILTAQRTIDVWLDARGAGDGPSRGPTRRRGAARAARRSPAAAASCSTRPPAPAARGRSRAREALDRARRDLELFLLQHRLDPLLARAGTAALDESAEPRDRRWRMAT